MTTGSFVFEGKGIAPKLEPYQPESRLDNKDCSTTVDVFLRYHLFQMETKIDPIKLCLAQLWLRSPLTKWLDIKLD